MSKTIIRLLTRFWYGSGYKITTWQERIDSGHKPYNKVRLDLDLQRGINVTFTLPTVAEKEKFETQLKEIKAK